MDGPGYEFVAYLRNFCGLKSTDYIWDLSAGCGLLELALESFRWKGRLLGTDIHRPSVEWAKKTISKRVPTFVFEHADIYNAAYAPSGRLTAAEWLSTFEIQVDVVVAKSVFTHMLPEDTRLYLEAMSQRLRPGGRALLSFFILNDSTAPVTEEEVLHTLQFTKGSPTLEYAVLRPSAPTAGVAYEERFLRTEFDRCGLRIKDIHYGYWSGRKDGMSFQDIVILTKD